jgi:hypothetical protein
MRMQRKNCTAKGGVDFAVGWAVGPDPLKPGRSTVGFGVSFAVQSAVCLIHEKPVFHGRSGHAWFFEDPCTSVANFANEITDERGIRLP